MHAALLNAWGDDLTVVDNARVSFSKASEWDFSCNQCGMSSETPPAQRCAGCMHVFKKSLKEGDKKLISYLARGMTSLEFEKFLSDTSDESLLLSEGSHAARDRLIGMLWQWRNTPEHWAPFANGVGAQFHIKIPIFLARQFDKHQVGFVKSEVSRRYIDSEPEFYMPEVWRARAANVKQGSSTNTFIYNKDDGPVVEYMHLALDAYNNLLAAGVCPEQARMVLPQSMYTEYRWSGSLYGWANVYKQRVDPHAQYEAQLVAKQIGEQMEKLFPVSWKALIQC